MAATEELEQNLVAFLLADTELGGLVGTRIYPDAAPVSAPRPYVSFFRVATERGGRRVEDMIDRLPKAWMQLDVTATSRKSARQVAKRIRELLDGYRGNLNGVQFVQSATVDGMLDGYEKPEAAGDVPVYRTSLDVSIWHQES